MQIINYTLYIIPRYANKIAIYKELESHQCNCLNMIFLICFMDCFNHLKCYIYIQLDVLTGMLPWFLWNHTDHGHYRSRRSSAELRNIWSWSSDDPLEQLKIKQTLTTTVLKHNLNQAVWKSLNICTNTPNCT